LTFSSLLFLSHNFTSQDNPLTNNYVCFFESPIITTKLTPHQAPNTPPTMDFVKNAMGGGNNNNNNENAGQNQQSSGSEQQKSDGGFLGGIGNKLNNAAGGGAEGEKKEDYLDKGTQCPSWLPRLTIADPSLLAGVDYVQENFLGQGKQDNESAIEQAKDEQISDFIRGQYKGVSGKEFPVADKWAGRTYTWVLREGEGADDGCTARDSTQLRLNEMIWNNIEPWGYDFSARLCLVKLLLEWRLIPTQSLARPDVPVK
jgi:hypothetical protein